MMRYIIAFLMLFVGVVSFVYPAHAAASLLKPKNPYVSLTDKGSAEDINVTGTNTHQKDSLINVIKGGVNWVLGILALIALIILMYGGFLMVTAAGDEEKYKKGFTILKQAAIGLILIGVAWFIISIIFWLVNKTTDKVGPANTEK